MLTSIQNPLVKEIRKLHQAKGRREQGLFLLEGTHLLTEACAVNYPLSTVCCSPEWQTKHDQLWEIINDRAERVELVSDRVLESIATTVNPDGVVATAPRHIPKLGQFHSLGVLLERIQDPGNLGTIIRTAAAAGADGLCLSGDSVDLDHPKVLRASVGDWFRLPMAVNDNLAVALSHYQAQGMQIVATVPDASLTYWDIDWKQPSLILLGNEGAGLSENLLGLVEKVVRIPLRPGVESLNVAIAAALILYEVKRQRLMI